MRSDELVEAIYAAAVDNAQWQCFVDLLAEVLGGQCVGFHLRLPTQDTRPVWYGHGFRRDLDGVFVNQLRAGVPWEPARTAYWLKGFASSSRSADRQAIEADPIYASWFVPHAFTSEPPVGFTVAVEEGRALAGVVIFNPQGVPWLDEQDFALLASLIPHLRRAHDIHTRLHEAQALSEALDRMPIGLSLLNAGGRAVLSNRTARAISDQNDGFALVDGHPRVHRRGDQERLHRLIDQALHPDESSSRGHGVMAIARRGDHRPYNVLVTPLLDAQQESTLRDAVIALYISDLDRSTSHRSEALRTLYALTQAESELVELLCEGLSLDEAARHRGVTTNTARSQLKQIFVKTRTSRQSELVRLVLAGLPPID